MLSVLEDSQTYMKAETFLPTDERRCEMAKVLRCRDVGMDCDFVARADSEEEILKKAAEHAAAKHDMKEIPEEVLSQVRAAIRDE
jgi:predicted small metal-binding protein